jgi:hypothetical protein
MKDKGEKENIRLQRLLSFSLIHLNQSIAEDLEKILTSDKKTN